MMSIAIPRLPPGVLVCVFSPRCSTTSQSFTSRDHKSKPCISPPWHQGLRETPFGCHSPLWGHTPRATAAPSCLGDCPPGLPFQSQPILPHQQWCLESCLQKLPTQQGSTGVLVLQPRVGTLSSVKGKGKR